MVACLLKSDLFKTPVLVNQKTLFASCKGLKLLACSCCRMQGQGFSSEAFDKNSDLKQLEEQKDVNPARSPNVIDTTKLSEVTDTAKLKDVVDTKVNSELLDISQVAVLRQEIDATKRIENFSEEEKEKLDKLKLEYELGRDKYIMPKEVANHDWLKLMELDTFDARLYFHRKLVTRERKKQKRKRHEEKRDQREGTRLTNKEQKTENKVLVPVTDDKEPAMEDKEAVPRLNLYYNRQGKYDIQVKRTAGCHSLLFGSPLVFDFASKNHHIKEANFLSTAVRNCYDINIRHCEPFHIHLTGVRESFFLENLDKNFFIDVHKEDVFDIFPAERLVYLTPHSSTLLQHSRDDILVVSTSTQWTSPGNSHWDLQRVEQLGVRSACLPVHSYVRTKMKKNLINLETILKILLDYNFTKDWGKALKHMDEALTTKDRQILKELMKIDRKAKSQIKIKF